MSIFANCNLFQSCSSRKQSDSLPFILNAYSSNSYTVQHQHKNSPLVLQRGLCEKEIEFIHHQYNINLIENKYQWIKLTAYSLDDNLIVLHIKNSSPEALSKHYKILYCQNENSDLGLCLPFLIDFSTQTRTDVISFDYSGCGCSNGKFSIENILEDIKRVTLFTTTALGCPINELILFGESIGTKCVLYLGMQPGFKHLKGMILLSPLFSQKESKRIPLDSYGEIMCPVFIIQGIERGDQHLNQIQSSIEFKQFQFPSHWSPVVGPGVELLFEYRIQFYIKIKHFIQCVIENDRLTQDSYDEENGYSINDNDKIPRKKVDVISNYINSNNQRMNSNSTCERGNGNKREISIQRNDDKGNYNNDKHHGIYSVDNNTPDAQTKKATLQNHIPSINSRNIMYKNNNERSESNVTYDLFS